MLEEPQASYFSWNNSEWYVNKIVELFCDELHNRKRNKLHVLSAGHCTRKFHRKVCTDIKDCF
jgi:hypothetical protein